MFDKQLNFTVLGYRMYETESLDELQKVASDMIEIPDDFTFDPDFVYLLVQIVSSGEHYGSNKNADYFPQEELMRTFQTFDEAHAFKNHENKQVEKAIGRIYSRRWNPVMKCVELFKGIDRKIAPEIARGYEKGYITDVSMGCRVPFTICSICGNKARRPSEFCDHVKKYRNEYLPNGEKVFEINYQPKFHDSSAVLNGAERVAKALMVISPGQDQAKFRKVAGQGYASYIPLSAPELEKVAAAKDNLPALLRPDSLPKVASASGLMQKLAEIEKQLTGKLLNIASTPSEDKLDRSQAVLNIVKFLSEKRMDESTLNSISTTLQQLAKSENLPISRVFSSFLAIAELLGIELYPQELHSLLSQITSAKLQPDLALSQGKTTMVLPSDYTSGINKVITATEQLPQFKDSSSLAHMYEEGAFRTGELEKDPFRFVKSMPSSDDLDSFPSTKVVRIIHRTLAPWVPLRSSASDHLLPRLAAILTSDSPLLGDATVGRDVDILANPQSIGDMLASFGYSNYQRLRPTIRMTRLIKMAEQADKGLEKAAFFQNPFKRPVVNTEPESVEPPAPEPSVQTREGYKATQQTRKELHGSRPAEKFFSNPHVENFVNRAAKGMSHRSLLLTALPLVYSASAYEKSRRDNGHYLNNTEAFIANKPNVITGTMLIGAKRFTRGIGKGMQGGYQLGKHVFGKEASLREELQGDEWFEILKTADVFPSGEYHACSDENMERLASETELSTEEAHVLKIATLLKLDGMEKEATDLLHHYDMPEHAPVAFLQKIASYTEEEISKVANDFLKNLAMDVAFDGSNLTHSIPGRMVDAFVFDRLGKMVPKQPEQPEQPGHPEQKGNGGNTNELAQGAPAIQPRS